MPLDTLHGVNGHILILQEVSACEMVKRNIRNFMRQNAKPYDKSVSNDREIHNGEQVIE